MAAWFLGVKPCALGLLKKPLRRIIFFYKNRGIGAEEKLVQLLTIIISVYFSGLYPSSVIVKLLSQSSQETGAT